MAVAPVSVPMWRLAKNPVPAAFTLVEILVVLAIILVLAAMLAPAIKNARHTSAAAKCAGNLCQLGLGIAIYAAENHLCLPPGTEYTAEENPDGTLNEIRVNRDPAFPAQYIEMGPKPWKIYSCPADRTQTRGQNYLSYAGNYHHLIPYVNGKPRVDHSNPTGRRIRLEEAQNIILWVDGIAPHEASSWTGGEPRPNTNLDGVAGALTNSNPHRVISQRHNGNVNALFGDGSVRFMTKAEACDPKYLSRLER